MPELSVGSESDPVTVLNMVMVTAANKFRDSSYFVSLACSHIRLLSYLTLSL